MGLFTKTTKQNSGDAGQPGPGGPGEGTSPPETESTAAEEWGSYDLSPTSSLAQSVALSEAETLLQTKTDARELQETFDANFSGYFPYVLRKARLEAGKEQAHKSVAPTRYDNDAGYPSDSDDATVLEQESPPRLSILGKPTSVFNAKRELLLVSELFKNGFYIFASPEAYETFKELRNSKKSRKNSAVVYDSTNGYRRVSVSEVTRQSGSVVDSRTHIIPAESKESGVGLPLFRVQIPYLTLRKNSPSIVFRRYREIPLQPRSGDTGGHDDDNEYETYPFCSVYSKYMNRVRRLVFSFKDEQGNFVSKVVLFSFLDKPFSDFNYKGTRFRVTGTTILAGFNVARPNFKLLVLDDDMPSLCDDIVEKKPGFALSKIIKRKDGADEGVHPPDSQQAEYEDPGSFNNPSPNPSNPIFADERLLPIYKGLARHISNNMPPFGTLQERSAQGSSNILPKKFSEIGKIEVYQDFGTGSDRNSTLSVDEDIMVLTCVLSTLYEICVKNVSKTPSNGGANGRLSTVHAIAGTTFAGGMTHHLNMM